jgi:hypothetical protein
MYKQLLCRLLYPLGAILCIAFASSLGAAPPMGAVVQTWHYDAATNTVTARIVNTSEKDITAFNISITEMFADHSVRSHEVLVDMVDTLALLQRVKGTSEEDRIRKDVGDGILPAKRSRDKVFSYPDGKVVTDFQASIDVIAYSDNTAEATNTAALARLKGHRSAELHSHQKANEIIKSVLADSSIASPSEEAAARLEKFLTVWRAQSHSSELDLDAGTIEGAVRDLRNAPRIAAAQHLGETEFLQRYASEKDQHISFLSSHSQLRTEGMQ